MICVVCQMNATKETIDHWSLRALVKESREPTRTSQRWRSNHYRDYIKGKSRSLPRRFSDPANKAQSHSLTKVWHVHVQSRNSNFCFFFNTVQPTPPFFLLSLICTFQSLSLLIRRLRPVRNAVFPHNLTKYSIFYCRRVCDGIGETRMNPTLKVVQ